MTVNAGRLSMTTGKRKARYRVIKIGRGPGLNIVAGNAVLVKVGGLMVRIGGSLIFTLVARNTVANGAGKLTAMAGDTLEIGMAALKSEFVRVFVTGIAPGVGGKTVTRFALSGKARENVIRISGSLEVVLVTAGALHRCAGKIVAQGILMTRVAVCSGMNSDQRKSLIGVLFKQVFTVFPAFGGVAALTLSTEFAAVNIAVTVSALVLGFGEFQIAMAGGAGCLGVGTDQGKAGILMRKTAISPELSPGIRGVAGFALESNVAVGVSGTS
jgi:hypothetical protein